MPTADWGFSGPRLTVILSGAILIVAILVGRIVVLARRRDLTGYRFGPHVFVRCRDGHLFTTTWVPLVSLKAVRLGLIRVQYCPVGRHLTLVRIVRDQDLTESERRVAEQFDDGGVP